MASAPPCCLLPAPAVPKGQEHTQQSRGRPGAKNYTQTHALSTEGETEAVQRSRGHTWHSPHGPPSVNIPCLSNVPGPGEQTALRLLAPQSSLSGGDRL